MGFLKLKCEHCSKEYQYAKAFQKHWKKCNERSEDTQNRRRSLRVCLKEAKQNLGEMKQVLKKQEIIIKNMENIIL